MTDLVTTYGPHTVGGLPIASTCGKALAAGANIVVLRELAVTEAMAGSLEDWVRWPGTGKRLSVATTASFRPFRWGRIRVSHLSGGFSP